MDTPSMGVSLSTKGIRNIHVKKEYYLHQEEPT